MTRRLTYLPLAAILTVFPALSEAGPPLICHQFQTAGGELLPWGSGSSWNNPDRRYDVQRLTSDVLRLLSPDAPVLTRMENLRRAAIYAVQNKQVADQLLQALIGRAASKPTAETSATALFDAGYLIEAYKQSTHMHQRPAPTEDGYAMVVRAITSAGGDATMEFAASLMTSGAQADAHVRRAKAAAASQPLLAQNIDNLWR
jgi:rhamnogalacturonyl hydrolase YesR